MKGGRPRGVGSGRRPSVPTTYFCPPRSPTWPWRGEDVRTEVGRHDVTADPTTKWFRSETRATGDVGTRSRRRRRATDARRSRAAERPDGGVGDGTRRTGDGRAKRREQRREAAPRPKRRAPTTAGREGAGSGVPVGLAATEKATAPRALTPTAGRSDPSGAQEPKSAAARSRQKRTRA